MSGLDSFTAHGLYRVGEGGQFSAAVNLVEVYATVTDASGRPITGLPQAAFTVQEDGVTQEIAAFASGDIPLSLAIGIDRSFSVPKPRLLDESRAVRGLLDDLQPDDRTLLMAIGSQPEILAPLGADRATTRDALGRVDSWGTTPLHDAAIAAIDTIAETRGRRALILLSDGGERYSQATAAAVIDHARGRDVIVYPVAIGQSRPPLFAELATATGGRSFHASDEKAMRAALSAIAGELRSQYLLGYVPSAAVTESTRWRTIRVTVSTSGARVRARDGYFAR